MSFIRHSHVGDAEEDFAYTYRPPRSHHSHRQPFKSAQRERGSERGRESGNNQEEDEQPTGVAKSRSLSLCPSTFAAAQAWQQWRESLREDPRSRSKSLFVGELTDVDPVRLGLSPFDEDYGKEDSEDDEDKEERASTSLLDALSPQKTSLALRTMRPRWSSAAAHANSNETTSKVSPRSVSARKSERTVDAKRMSLKEPLRIEHEREGEGGEEQVVRLIPLRALLNYNRDLSGVRLSRAARIRRENPALPTSPTDRLGPSPQQRLRSRRESAELQTEKGGMIAQF